MKEPDPRTAPPPEAETAEMLAVEAFLRAHDPALAFPAGFDAARERRLLRYMRHPRLALLLLHHRTASLLGAAAIVALVALALWWLVRERPEDPILAIEIRPAPGEAPAAPLEPAAPAEDPTDRAEPLPFDDPVLSIPLPEPPADNLEPAEDGPAADGPVEDGPATASSGDPRPDSRD